MDPLFQPPAVTLFDAVTSTIAAVSYLAVGLAAIARAPRDERARVFLAVALTSAVAYAGPGLQYWKGIPIISRPVVVPTLVATAIGGVALFHFAFVFPWRRPWLRRHREWVMAAYLVAPMGVLWLAWLAPPSLDALEVPYMLALLAVGVPLMALAGVVMPLAGLLVLYKTCLRVRDLKIEAARVSTLGVFVSQLAGGILAVLVAPLVHIIVPSGPWAPILAGAMFGFGILMPLAFAAGVWKYGVLTLDVESLPGQ